MIDLAIDELTRILIKQDLKDKKENSKEMLTLSKVELIQLCIKLLKLLKQ